MAKRPVSAEPFSNRALFERSSDPVFVLNQRRRLRYANPAFEQLTRQPLADLYNLHCVRDRRATPLAQALCPPPEVMTGTMSAARRPVPPARVGPPWWDISYFPLMGEKGLLGIVGRIGLVGGAAAPRGRALPEGLLQLRRRQALRWTFAALNGHSPGTARLVEQARVASRNTAPVLLVGAAGAGKAAFARAIHHQGITAERSYLAVDCAALPAEELELLIFGEAGAAHAATLGTIVLREPAALPRELQARLVEWMGGDAAAAVRVVGACSREPVADVAAGRLLEELRLALDIQSIRLPPLRERIADLPALAASMLQEAGAAPSLSPEVLEVLSGHAWPGNLRELRDALRAAAASAAGGPIEAAHLPAGVRERSPLPRMDAAATFPLKEMLRDMQARLILFALRRARGHKVEAARLLDISRSELWRRMGELNIGEDDWRRPLDEEAGGDATPPDRGV